MPEPQVPGTTSSVGPSGVVTVISNVSSAPTVVENAEQIGQQLAAKLAQPPVTKEPESQLERLAASMVPLSADPMARTVDICWYSGAPVMRQSWSGCYKLTLSMDPGAVRLDRLNVGAPVLNAHSDWSVCDVIGVIVPGTARIEKGKGLAKVRFSDRAEVEPIWRDVMNGILCNLSVGFMAYKRKDTTPKDAEGNPMIEDGRPIMPSFMVTDWEPMEVSVVPIPADAGAQFLSASGKGGQHEDVARASAPNQQKEITTMADTQVALPGAEARTQAESEALRGEGAQQERKRQSDIRSVVSALALPTEFAETLVNGNHTIDKARELAINEKAKQAGPEIIGAHAEVTADARDKFRAGMEAALEFRADPSNKDLAERGKEFAGLNLPEMARECLESIGCKTRGKSHYTIVRAALEPHSLRENFVGIGMMTTSDFPAILANVLNKRLRQAYQSAPQTFKPWSRQVTASDFKPLQPTQLSDLPTLLPVNEKGEFERVGMTDSKESYSLKTFGHIVPITRQVIINDDMNAFSRIPQAIGTAAANFESDKLYAVLTANAAMNDTVALFHATHANLITGAGSALAIAGLNAARAKFRGQTAPKGTILNLIPRYLVVPAALEGAALQLLFPQQYAPSTTATIIPNWVTNLTLVVEPRLDANSTAYWYLMADPGQIDTVEYAYLEGQQGVYTETRQGFDVDGIEIKARLDFAAAAVDYRGMQRNNGA